MTEENAKREAVQRLTQAAQSDDFNDVYPAALFLDPRRAIRKDLRLVLAALSPSGEAFQPRVKPWMHACFGDVIPYDKVERGDRLLEEVFELLQSGGYDPARVLALRDYVWGRDVGEPAQEVGGVMVTLAAYCLAFGLDMHQAGETELARIWTKVEVIRAKQAAKPTGSALPIAVAQSSEAALARAIEGLKEARDLLLERRHGSHARSPGHNARLAIEAALSSLEVKANA